MAVFTAIASALAGLAGSAGAIGTAATVVGTAASVAGGFQQAAGQRKAQNAQKYAENIKQKQMELEAQRRQRQIIREQQIARANSLATTTAQGAASEGSSALGGAEGTIFGQGGRAIQETNSNATFGGMIFDANRRATAGYAMAARGGTLASAGSGLSSLGQGFIKNMEVINRVGGRS